jgi:hypothetical protein
MNEFDLNAEAWPPGISNDELLSMVEGSMDPGFVADLNMSFGGNQEYVPHSSKYRV